MQPEPEPCPRPLRRGVLNADALPPVALFPLTGGWLELRREAAALFPLGGQEQA